MPLSTLDMILHLLSLEFYFKDLEVKGGRRHCVTNQWYMPGIGHIKVLNIDYMRRFAIFILSREVW